MSTSQVNPLSGSFAGQTIPNVGGSGVGFQIPGAVSSIGNFFGSLFGGGDNTNMYGQPSGTGAGYWSGTGQWVPGPQYAPGYAPEGGTGSYDPYGNWTISYSGTPAAGGTSGGSEGGSFGGGSFEGGGFSNETPIISDPFGTGMSPMGNRRPRRMSIDGGGEFLQNKGGRGSLIPGGFGNATGIRGNAALAGAMGNWSSSGISDVGGASNWIPSGSQTSNLYGGAGFFNPYQAQ